MTALEVEEFAPPVENFKCRRDFTAWLGRLSKATQAYIRRLLIIGAMLRLNWLGHKSIPETFMAHESPGCLSRLHSPTRWRDLGLSYDKRRLSSSGAGGGVINMPINLPAAGKREE